MSEVCSPYCSGLTIRYEIRASEQFSCFYLWATWKQRLSATLFRLHVCVCLYVYSGCTSSAGGWCSCTSVVNSPVETSCRTSSRADLRTDWTARDRRVTGRVQAQCYRLDGRTTTSTSRSETDNVTGVRVTSESSQRRVRVSVVTASISTDYSSLNVH